MAADRVTANFFRRTGTFFGVTEPKAPPGVDSYRRLIP
jgi:hypothetical protein